MFELFIALFGSLFWGGKLLNEKIETKHIRTTYEQNAVSDSQRKQDWINKVTDKQLEEEFELWLYNLDYDKIWAEVSDAYKEMPWQSDKNFICITPEHVEYFYGKGTYPKKVRDIIAKYEREDVLRILMAKQGKLLYSDACYGISRHGELLYPSAIAREKCINETKFIEWITNKLKLSGINERVFIEQSTNYYLASKYPTYSGTYKWECLIPTFLQHNKHC